MIDTGESVGRPFGVREHDLLRAACAVSSRASCRACDYCIQRINSGRRRGCQQGEGLKEGETGVGSVRGRRWEGSCRRMRRGLLDQHSVPSFPSKSELFPQSSVSPLPLQTSDCASAARRSGSRRPDYHLCCTTDLRHPIQSSGNVTPVFVLIARLHIDHIRVVLPPSRQQFPCCRSR